ncbi:uncharacterized protein LTHEOB_8136 [Lasiodiplodia theobromae]|uniref:uncharacterized protein n=1 Tax=Lasiodiplodia theobromae TaxID=45133 RepID=UPI0015C2F15C|nr:uncharacterized protein LTHEOB_8136 [Lasiodiplodia theobromae]KAF4541982.1 hypothetical protein LTHEOB_8136 [Lasiodiplodia theobromae]
MGSFTERSCPKPISRVPAKDLSIGVTLHELLIYIAAPCTIITGFFSLVLVFKHLCRYTKPTEQRQIVRLIITPAIFAVFSLLALIFYDENEYITPLPDLYEAFALACLFILFTHYAQEPTTIHHNGNVETTKNLDSGHVEGLQKAWVAVFQYPVVKTILTIATEASLATGKYCASSRSVHFAHIWIVVIGDISLVVCFLAILEFYKTQKAHMTVHKPLLKLLSFKLIVFIIFVQNLVFNFISIPDGLSADDTVAPRDIKYGLPAFLVCVEMVFFSLFFFFSFGSRIYHPSKRHPEPREHFLVALFHVLNPADVIRDIAKMFSMALSGQKKSSGGFGGSSSRHGGHRSSRHGHHPRYEHRSGHGHRMRQYEAPRY